MGGYVECEVYEGVVEKVGREEGGGMVGMKGGRENGGRVIKEVELV